MRLDVDVADGVGGVAGFDAEARVASLGAEDGRAREEAAAATPVVTVSVHLTHHVHGRPGRGGVKASHGVGARRRHEQRRGRLPARREVLRPQAEAADVALRWREGKQNTK